MLDVLVYLFETYMHNESEMPVDQDKLAYNLSRIGFYREDIYSALDWLKTLADLQGREVTSCLYDTESSALRIYTEEESMRLDMGCRGFILFLEQAGVLDFATREMVIDRVMALDIKQLNQEELKWVVLMVLSNMRGYENYYKKMEEFLF